MLETITRLDTSLLLYLNGHHNAFFDQVMWLASAKFTWIPLYALFLWMLYREYPKKYWLVLITIALMILVSDQICNLFKESVLRYRPSHDPALQQMIHIVNGYTGGVYGFYSGHATNSFAVALFVINLLRGHRRVIIPVALAYALLVSYSRIYLGVHYPLDVITGIIAGTLIGWGAAKAYLAVSKQHTSISS